MSLLKLLSENLKLIIIALISIILVLMIAILLSISFGGDVVRQPVISEIRGEVYIYRGNTKLSANKKHRVMSGDVIYTGDDSSVTIMTDSDKYIIVEGNSSVTVYYTEVADKGTVDVSISEGSVLCRLDKELGKKAVFKVRTPNAVVNVKGTVFRTSFRYEGKYLNYDEVYITEVQNFDGTVNIQLFDYKGNEVDLPMLLIERTSAKMITAADISQYIFLNHDTDMYSLPERTLVELLRMSIDRTIAYVTDELNTAYKAVMRINKNESAATETEAEISESITQKSSVTTSKVTEAATTAERDVLTQGSTPDTLATTRETHVYTTYSGERWWEISNSGANISNDDNFDDGGVFNGTSSVTTEAPAQLETDPVTYTITIPDDDIMYLND